MVTLEKLKLYLRIDVDDEDELLTDLLNTAKNYLHGAVSNFDEYYLADEKFASKADFLQMVLAAEFYLNRDNDAPRSFSYTVNSLIAQLQYYAEEGALHTEGGA